MSIQAIKDYQSEVEKIIHYGGTKKETSIRNAFYVLLNDYAKQKGFMLVPEVSVRGKMGRNVTPDGTIKDFFRQDWGYWESKDEADIIDDEIDKKFSKGYPDDNILFEDSNTAVLIQSGNEMLRVSMKDAKALDTIITAFINYERPEVKNFRDAIEHFKQDIPRVTEVLRNIINEQETKNKEFVTARDKFLELCKESINPSVVVADVTEMMIQHILTEDIFNVIFDETQFHRENNIARELEKVIHTFFTGDVRRSILAKIQHYFQTINTSAANIPDHHEKQKFLKVLYETFYKSYNPKAADRLGVVYTPNEIVRFMVESTDHLLNKHFGKFLEDKNVEILDPATGTERIKLSINIKMKSTQMRWLFFLITLQT
jgi:predicted helicase